MTKGSALPNSDDGLRPGSVDPDRGVDYVIRDKGVPPVDEEQGGRGRRIPGLSFRSLAPNFVTSMALCTGLSAAWFAFSGRWESAIAAILIAATLDALDGRVARLLRGESRFGAELDSLSDVIAFGVTPAIVMFLWSLQFMPRFGWTVCLFYALCCALRLARFNARIDDTEQPHKSLGYLTGVPAPAGAGLAVLPLILWLAFGLEVTSVHWLVAPWLFFVAILMISSIATFSLTSLRLRKNVRFEAIAIAGLIGAAFITVPWVTLSIILIGYLLLLPVSFMSYRRVKRRRAGGAAA